VTIRDICLFTTIYGGALDATKSQSDYGFSVLHASSTEQVSKITTFASDKKLPNDEQIRDNANPSFLRLQPSESKHTSCDRHRANAQIDLHNI